MKIAKIIAVFGISFLFAWIIIRTFDQEPFREYAPILIPWFSKPVIPIWAYVASVFGIGLLLGFAASAYYYLVGQVGIRRKNVKIGDLEQELAQAKIELEQARKECGQDAENEQKADGEEPSDNSDNSFPQP